LTIQASGGELLALDWNKYRPWVIALGGADRVLRVWDCRMPTTPMPIGGTCEAELKGHELAVRATQWSPHRADVISSAGYDMTARVWTTAPIPRLVSIHDAHTEFVAGCAWALFEDGVLASVAWDGRIHVYRV